MSDSFCTWELGDIIVGEDLPASVYLFIDFRFITFRAEGDCLDRNAFDRLSQRNVKQLFIRLEDREKMEAWKNKFAAPPSEPATPEDKALNETRDEVTRKLMDIFHNQQSNKVVTQALEASKKLVGELMKTPLAVRSLGQLQSYSRGTVEHSVNVSILSTYLALNMGYSHAKILQNIATGALLHDVGKAAMPQNDGESDEAYEARLHQHPLVSEQVVAGQSSVPEEVKKIVAHHHECWDGNGYPQGLRGQQIYDLARIVSIANVFDELVGKAKGPLMDRQRAAISKLQTELSSRFCPEKLGKALKILKFGI